MYKGRMRAMAPRSRGIVRGEKGRPLCVQASDVDLLGFGAKLLTGALLECFFFFGHLAMYW